MPTLDPTKLTPRDIVVRRIRRDWRGEIVVLDVGEDDDGRPWVDVGASSWIACEQARISLGAFVRNDAADWDAWGPSGVDEHPYSLRLYEPNPKGYDPFAAD